MHPIINDLLTYKEYCIRELIYTSLIYTAHISLLHTVLDWFTPVICLLLCTSAVVSEENFSAKLSWICQTARRVW